jgi:hypothetical protein
MVVCLMAAVSAQAQESRGAIADRVSDEAGVKVIF